MSDSFDPNSQDDNLQDDDQKHQAAKPPSVVGEEDAMSGDVPAESPDIDEELKKVGLKGDDEEIKPLGVDDNIE